MTVPEQKKAIVPRLRFPEFRNTGPWEVKRLGELFCERSERGGNELELLSVTISDGVVRAAELERQNNANADLSNYKKVCPGDIVYNSMRMWQGASGVSWWHGVVSPAYTVVTPKESQNAVFWAYCFKLEHSIAKFARFSQGVTSDTWNLKYPAFSAIEMAYPAEPAEQQKIADCLSSLDELIELQAKRLEALQAHKKGLMQQLFPREGETTPRLRFPEFRNAGPWENIQVSDFGTIVTGKTPSTSNSKYWNGRFAWVTPTDIADTKYIYTTGRLLTSEGVQLIGVLPENTVLITCIASIGKNAILKVPGSCNQQINAIIPNTNFNSDFIYYLFCKNQTILQNQAGTSATAIVPKSAFEKLYFHVPKLPEQQKIADCLSSLDELIELQAKRLEALQAHKKGLMQQLFPQENDL